MDFWVLDNIEALRQSNFPSITETTLFKPANTIRYRYPSANRGDQSPNYPEQTVAIDYFLPEKVSNLTLEIKDAAGNSMITFVSDTSNNKLEDEVINDMNTSRTEYIINRSLTTKKGMNRFEWDMTMAGPWHKQAGRRYRGGPMVKPGVYTVELTSNKNSMTQSFELLIDPRVASFGISEDDISKQVGFQLKVSELLSSVRKLEDELATKIESMSSTADMSVEDKTRLNESKALLAQLETAEGIYMKPMLSSQVSYLYSMLNQADQVPGKDAYERYDELNKLFHALKAQAPK